MRMLYSTRMYLSDCLSFAYSNVIFEGVLECLTKSSVCYFRQRNIPLNLSVDRLSLVIGFKIIYSLLFRQGSNQSYAMSFLRQMPLTVASRQTRGAVLW